MYPLLKAKEIIKKKYSENNTNYPLFLLSLYGILKKYPNEEKLIEDIFLKTDIYIEEDSISNILKRHNINCFDYEEEEQEENTIYGISSHNHNLIIEEDETISFQEENPFLVCSKKECNNTILLNTFIHELLHLIKSDKDNFYYQVNNKDFSYYIRSGISHYEYHYDSKEDTLTSLEYFDTLDEAINVIETTEVMENILSIKDIIEDDTIKNYFSSLDNQLFTKDSGYEEAVSIIRPLWKLDSFKELIRNNILEGNIKEIIKEFDSKTYPNAFEELAELIDKIDSLTGSNKRNKKLLNDKRKVNEIIKEYKKNNITKVK